MDDRTDAPFDAPLDDAPLDPLLDPLLDPGLDDPWERPVDRFRRTAAGSVVAAGLLGLRDVMEGRPEREEVTIVQEAPTRPVADLDVVIDPDHPERTVAIVRRRSA